MKNIPPDSYWPDWLDRLILILNWIDKNNKILFLIPPLGMRSLRRALYLTVMGKASFLSSLLITVVEKLTEKGGSEGWFAKDLNKSRLDHFHCLLAAIITFVYVYVAKGCSDKNVQVHRRMEMAKSCDQEYDDDDDDDDVWV